MIAACSVSADVSGYRSFWWRSPPAWLAAMPRVIGPAGEATAGKLHVDLLRTAIKGGCILRNRKIPLGLRKGVAWLLLEFKWELGGLDMSPEECTVIAKFNGEIDGIAEHFGMYGEIYVANRD